jgi:hypothetical protein
MSISLRTVLMWLEEHRLHDDAECWVLGGDTVEPVHGVTWEESGDMVLHSRPPWTEPAPTPLQYAAVRDTLLEHYAGGGRLKWAGHPDVYRGSYVVNAESSVFFVFLPTEIQIVDSHEEKMEQRKKQAIDLTRKIEESQSWPTSM